MSYEEIELKLLVTSFYLKFYCEHEYFLPKLTFSRNHEKFPKVDFLNYAIGFLYNKKPFKFLAQVSPLTYTNSKNMLIQLIIY